MNPTKPLILRIQAQEREIAGLHLDNKSLSADLKSLRKNHDRLVDESLVLERELEEQSGAILAFCHDCSLRDQPGCSDCTLYSTRLRCERR